MQREYNNNHKYQSHQTSQLDLVEPSLRRIKFFKQVEWIPHEVLKLLNNLILQRFKNENEKKKHSIELISKVASYRCKFIIKHGNCINKVEKCT